MVNLNQRTLGAQRQWKLYQDDQIDHQNSNEMVGQVHIRSYISPPTQYEVKNYSNSQKTISNHLEENLFINIFPKNGNGNLNNNVLHRNSFMHMQLYEHLEVLLAECSSDSICSQPPCIS